MRRLAPLVLLLLTACAAVNQSTDVQPPWSFDKLNVREIDSAYLQAWQTAPNKHTCMLIAPRSLGVSEPVTARVAQFSGGWGVAYDTASVRSAFGVAGTGVRAQDPWEYQWPNNRTFPHGSRIGWGPEGGTGPNQLAYIRIAEQDCLYNVWSRLGPQHLEQLIENLRLVNAPLTPAL